MFHPSCRYTKSRRIVSQTEVLKIAVQRATTALQNWFYLLPKTCQIHTFASISVFWKFLDHKL